MTTQKHDILNTLIISGFALRRVSTDIRRKREKGIVYSTSMLQIINSVLCGYYCLYFIVHCCQGCCMQDIILDFTQVPSLGNERRVLEEF